MGAISKKLGESKSADVEGTIPAHEVLPARDVPGDASVGGAKWLILILCLAATALPFLISLVMK